MSEPIETTDESLDVPQATMELPDGRTVVFWWPGDDEPEDNEREEAHL